MQSTSVPAGPLVVPSWAWQSARVRIVVVSANQSVVGGVETYLAWLLPALQRRGHEVGFAFEVPAKTAQRAIGAGLPGLVRWHIDAMPRRELLTQIADYRPDVVFMHACEDEHLDLELASRFRCILFAHAFYAACATGSRVQRLPERHVCEREFGAACLAANYLFGCGTKSPRRLLGFYDKQATRRRVLQQLSGLAVGSQFMRSLYIQHGVAESSICVLPPPADAIPDPEPPPARSLERLLFLGRLAQTKGPLTAIEAVAYCQARLGRALRLTLAGEGEQLEECQALARRVGVNAEFPGWVGPEQRTALLRSASVLLVPSAWPEPFGMVGLEAACVGTPCVGFAAGGVVDWLRAGETGELAPARGFRGAELARALERALESPEHHRSLQLGAWRMAAEFVGEKHLDRLEQFFEQTLAT